MIVTVTPNPAIDMTYIVASLDEGESHRVEPAAVRAGGKGVNVARVVHQVSHPVTAIVPLGGEAGRQYDTELSTDGLPHSVVTVLAPTRRSIAIVDEQKNITTLLNETGHPLTESEWTAVRERVLKFLPAATCLVGSGSLPPGAPVDFYADLVWMAKRSGIPAVMDATGGALLRAAEAGAEVLKPNRRELREATGATDPVHGARILLDRGARLILVSLGAEGMIVISADAPNHPVRARLAQPLSGNPTGAGDAAVAAAAVMLSAGNADPVELLRQAAGWSTAAVQAPLAGELPPGYPDFAARLIIDRY